jgi:uracil-DNA glycosylase
MSIAIVGEAWGENEEKERAPFVGASGYHLTLMLNEAGINRANCFLTNVFNLRPEGNRIETLCGGKDEALDGYPALIKGKFVREEFEPELLRLKEELEAARPNVVICLGNTALWALAGITAISKLRGSTRLATRLVPGTKLLPTYHPAAVLRQWELRPIVVVDLIKAARESAHPEIRRPKRQIYIPETIGDLYEYKARFIDGNPRLAVDTETAGNQITCIGFAPSTGSALVIPFVDPRATDRCYWRTKEDEFAAWTFIHGLLVDPRISKTFQNGLYDIAFLIRSYGIQVLSADEDTMLLHHALQPEALKGLGFLGSVYTDEGAWKQMREKHTTIKRDA